MPGGRGGRRQGTPGASYTNRTDLATDYAPSSAENTPASGGVHPVNTPQIPIYPEQVPSLTDPTGRPAEPVTTPGIALPADDIGDDLFRAYQMYGTEQLRQALAVYQARFGRK
jgi:hypothetical protein